MSTITQVVSPYTKVPSINSPSTFNVDVDVFLNEINSRVTQTNTQSEQMNTVAGEVNANAQQVANNTTAVEGWKNETLTARDEAVAAAATIPDGTINDTITTLVDTWSSQKISDELDLKIDVADIVDDLTNTDINKPLSANQGKVLQDTKLNATNPVIEGSITEDVYNLIGTEINPSNGTIQYKTVSANTTFTETLTAGQSVVLRLIDADLYTITFPTIAWVTATAPTLTSNCVIVLWKEQTTLYGAFVGSLV